MGNVILFIITLTIISCGNRKYIRENDKVQLEDKLGDIIIKLYEQSEETKNERLEREEVARGQRE